MPTGLVVDFGFRPGSVGESRARRPVRSHRAYDRLRRMYRSISPSDPHLSRSHGSPRFTSFVLRLRRVASVVSVFGSRFLLPSQGFLSFRVRMVAFRPSHLPVVMASNSSISSFVFLRILREGVGSLLFPAGSRSFHPRVCRVRFGPTRGLPSLSFLSISLAFRRTSSDLEFYPVPAGGGFSFLRVLPSRMPPSPPPIPSAASSPGPRHRPPPPTPPSPFPATAHLASRSACSRSNARWRLDPFRLPPGPLPIRKGEDGSDRSRFERGTETGEKGGRSGQPPVGGRGDPRTRSRAVGRGEEGPVGGESVGGETGRRWPPSDRGGPKGGRSRVGTGGVDDRCGVGSERDRSRGGKKALV